MHSAFMSLLLFSICFLIGCESETIQRDLRQTGSQGYSYNEPINPPIIPQPTRPYKQFKDATTCAPGTTQQPFQQQHQQQKLNYYEQENIERNKPRESERHNPFQQVKDVASFAPTRSSTFLTTTQKSFQQQQQKLNYYNEEKLERNRPKQPQQHNPFQQSTFAPTRIPPTFQTTTRQPFQQQQKFNYNQQNIDAEGTRPKQPEQQPPRLGVPNFVNSGPRFPNTGNKFENHGDGSEHKAGMPFGFEYGVNDAETRNDYSHNAQSDGDVVKGEYRTLMADGRTQVVTYTADWKNGYRANIKYLKN